MKLLILGVGNAQVDAITYLKDKGHFVYGCSYRDEGPGRELVDQFVLINITDKKAVEDYTSGNNINIVYSIGSDVAMPTTGYVSAKLGLPFFVPEDTAELLQNKTMFRSFQKRRELSPLPYLEGKAVSDFTSWDHYPSVIKPVDSQGQRGIFEVKNETDLRKCLPNSLSFSREKKVILEKYINGPEISVNAYVYDGNVKYSFISSREVLEGYPGGIVKGHRVPAQMGDAVQSNILHLVSETITCLGIQDGPVYFQIKYEGDKPYIIEVTPRLDGCHLWRLIKMAYGTDLLDLTFRHLLNEPLSFSDSLQEPLPLHLDFYLKEPWTKFSAYDNEITPGLLFNEFYYQHNETIRPITGIIEKVGYKISSSKRV